MLKIVLTGGPCSGKSSALSRLTQLLESRGYKVITVPEAATTLILNGISPSANISMEDFQNFVLDTQLAYEKAFEAAVKGFTSSGLFKALVVLFICSLVFTMFSSRTTSRTTRIQRDVSTLCVDLQ